MTPSHSHAHTCYLELGHFIYSILLFSQIYIYIYMKYTHTDTVIHAHMCILTSLRAID